MEFVDRLVGPATRWVGSAVLVLMALQILVDVVMRNTVGAGFPATADVVSKYYMIVVSFLPVAYAELQRRHVEASIFTDMLPKPMHSAIYFIGFLLSAVVYVLLAWGTATEALSQTRRGAYVEAGTLHFLTWPAYWILPICFSLMVLVVLVRLIQVMRGEFEDKPAAAAFLEDPNHQVE